MSRFLNDLGMQLLAGLLGTALVFFIGNRVDLPKMSVANVEFESLIGLLFLLPFFFMIYGLFKLWDQRDKETAKIAKLQIKEDAEIRKLTLQKQILELELEKQKRLLPPKR